MSEVLVIYDNNGIVFFHGSGDLVEPVGLQHLKINLQEGETVLRIDTNVIPHIPIIQVRQKSEIEEQLALIQAALDELLLGGI